MGVFSVRLILGFVIVIHSATFVFGGTLDDYYLKQFGETKNIQLQKAILSVSPESSEAVRCGMPLKHGLRRDWNLLEQTTQKALAKQLAAPVLTSPATYVSAAGHFTVHYATTGPNAPPLDDPNNNGVPEWVETVAATFEYVYTQYSTLGYQAAPTKPAGAPYDIYLLDLAPQGYYGITQSDQPASLPRYPNAFTSWMELDNNYTDSIYKPSTFTPLQSLQITAAHEYHHAVQYGYNYYFDIWYAEATSTWLEGELYESVKQLYNYIPAWFSNSSRSLDTFITPPGDTDQNLPLGYGYGRWIFNRYLSEKYSPAMIRGLWEKVGGLASPDGNADIPMAPVLDSLLSSTYASSLGIAFLDFTKRVYTRGWASHPEDIARIHPYAPLASYSAFPVYANTSPVPAITLPHYSFAYYTFVPSAGSPGNLPITITGTSGITATAFRKRGSTIDEFPFASVNGATVTVPAFSSSSEVVLLIANATSIDNHSANFSTNGTGQPVQEPAGGTVYPPLPPATPANDGGGSSGGCFIATAAYGSYLHPQVQQLRNFRDRHLLNNAPGRTFVALYYQYSPPLADFIGRHPALRGVARLLLTPLVVAVAYPLISAVFIFLLAGTVLISRRRTKDTCLNAHPHGINTTSYRL